MGNVATRKRPADKADEPERKRMRFSLEPHYEEINISSRLRFLRQRLQARRNDGRRRALHEPFSALTPSREDEVEEPHTGEVTPTPLKKDCPLPWFDVLFLPEFPTRSIINEKSFTLERQLGRGSFGTVYCASALHDSQRKFAIKVQQKNEVISRHAVLQVRREASIQVRATKSPQK
ncbi:unnamed protein product [Caenorhabditis auriculariae]|uniref:Protein kinase domain-containing protein n=1 Tax=Caenorhabditis auriculariae TaxID=2777116 RepID=A0A8S1GYT5_9PELO|nr:unnamed protein product [Caenorhabditis auriculariae]